MLSGGVGVGAGSGTRTPEEPPPAADGGPLFTVELEQLLVSHDGVSLPFCHFCSSSSPFSINWLMDGRKMMARASNIFTWY